MSVFILLFPVIEDDCVLTVTETWCSSDIAAAAKLILGEY